MRGPYPRILLGKGGTDIELIQQTANGIVLGSIYALVALGLTLIYGVLYIPDFALAHKGMVGAYLCYYLVALLKVNYWVAILSSMTLVGVLGILSEVLVYRPTLKAGEHVNGFIAAFGIVVFLESFALIFFGSQYKRIYTEYNAHIMNVFGVTITMQRLLVVITVVATIGLLQIFMKKTRLGLAIRAVSQEPDGALLMGINVKGVSLLTNAIGSALAGLAAGLIAPITLVLPAMGHTTILKAFIIIVLGGMGSIPGAILGGYVIGLTESLGGAFISSAFRDVFPFGALILVLAIRPTGIFGKAAR
jgi:branched-chain amino acid transport system permease protein